ncbi:redoxin family protein [soil metagenome]
MASGPQGRKRGVVLLCVAALAGLIAGAVAVYVRQSAEGNAAALADCAGALAKAAAIRPLAKGELAAFRVAERPELLRDLVFKGPDGKESGVAGLAGKTVLLNLCATWCVPCRAEMPALDRLQAEAGGADFAVVAVNLDVKNPERAQDFLGEIGVKNLAFYADPSFALFNTLKSRGLAFGLPTSLLIDGKGCRLGIVEGPAEWDSQEAKALIRAAAGPG